MSLRSILFCVILRNNYSFTNTFVFFLLLGPPSIFSKIVMPIYALFFLSLTNYHSGGWGSYLSTASCFLLFIYRTPLSILVAWSVNHLHKIIIRFSYCFSWFVSIKFSKPSFLFKISAVSFCYLQIVSSYFIFSLKLLHFSHATSMLLPMVFIEGPRLQCSKYVNEDRMRKDI